MSSSSITNNDVSTSSSLPLSGLDQLSNENKSFYKAGIGLFILSFIMLLSTLFMVRFRTLSDVFIDKTARYISYYIFIVSVIFLLISTGINGRSAALMFSDDLYKSRYYTISLVFAIISGIIGVVGAISLIPLTPSERAHADLFR